MNILPEISVNSIYLEEIYKDLHSHPELGFEEERTSKIVQEKLKEFGVDEIHTEIGKTGVVGIIKGNNGGGNRRIGLRADMDALPIQEDTGLSYASKVDGKMHACGHDAHTTMLLGAAKYLAKTRNFSGTAILIFQPAEEGQGGAIKMLDDGLFKKFPCDEIYGIHNDPNGKNGEIGICKGKAMAGAAIFNINIDGIGSHAAMPHQSKDPIIIAHELITQLQSILSRNVPPLETIVLSVTKIHAGSAFNVIPNNCAIAGTIRYFSDEVYSMVEERFKNICKGLELSNDVKIHLSIKKLFDVLVNDDEISDYYMDAAEKIVGEKNINRNQLPATGSEDFADMLRHVKGAYCFISHSGKAPLHSPHFTLDTSIIPIGASVLAKVVEDRLMKS